MKSKRWIAALILGLCASLVASVVTYTRLLERVDLSLAELYASYSGKTKASSEIVMIPVEENRLNLSLLMRALSTRPPRVTILYYDLSKSDESTGVFDIRLAEAMQYAGNVIVPLPAAHITSPAPQTNSLPNYIPYFVNVTGTLENLTSVKLKESPADIFRNTATFSIVETGKNSGLRVDLIYNYQNRVVPSLALQALIFNDKILERLVRIQTGMQIDWIALEKTRKIKIDDRGGFFLKRFAQDYDFKGISYSKIMDEYNKTSQTGKETPALDGLMEKIVIVFDPGSVSKEDAYKTGAILSSMINQDSIIEKRGWPVYMMVILCSMGLAFALLYFHREMYSIPLFCLLFLVGVGYFLFQLGLFIPIGGILAGSASIYLSCILLRKEISSGRIDQLF